MKRTISSSLLFALAALPAANANVFDFGSVALTVESSFDVSGSGSTGFGDSNITLQQSDNGTWWNGFTYSNRTDTALGENSVGYENAYTAIAGSGSGDDTYGVFYSSPDYGGAENILFSSAVDLNSIDLTNTTYVYYALLYGVDSWTDGPATTGFVTKNADNSYEADFGTTLTDFAEGDYFSVTATGYLDGAVVATDSFDLAYWDGDAFEIVSDWETWELGFTGIDELSFSFSSTDESWGYSNTPSYMAIDNIDYSLVPEPSAFALLLGAVALGVTFRRRR